MTSTDYDKAVHFLLEKQWDNLFVLMMHTNDDFLSKRIYDFLCDFQYHPNQLIYSHDRLIHYLDHAQQTYLFI
ncbi:YhdB family protein [Ornithinibacillus sp. 4-3]|uniref:YhdB family protein n=1 Tax=Ornithinibacillus sp. 4-3 TaxID=3231488 RepID=A0AB39HT62_9BACI